MDVGTGLALFGAAKMVEKLLGPTAGYIGGSLESWTKQRVENVRRVFSNAEAKLGETIERPGQVHPKVLKAVLDGASFADDPLAAEYFGGVLASSRSQVERDDRGAAFGAVVQELSVYQLRSHYLVYDAVTDLHAGLRRTPQTKTGDIVIYLPFGSWCTAMQLNEQEKQRSDALMMDAFFGLAARNLITDRWMSGAPEHLAKSVQGHCRVHAFDFPGYGLVVEPTVFGLQLFAYAHGKQDTAPDDMFAPGVSFPPLAGVPKVRGARRLHGFQRSVPAPAE